MESERAKKSRSIGSETKSSRPSKSSRPGLGERVQSSPSLTTQRESQSKPAQRSSRTSTTSTRTSKTLSRDGVSIRSRDSTTVSSKSSRPPSQETSSTKLRNSSRGPDTSQLNLAVLSAPKAGKSFFIQQALGIRKLPSALSSSTEFSLEGTVYRVQLVELSLDDVDFSNGRRVSWPKYINGELLPPIDGVLCLYDVTNQESIAEVPPLLATLSNSNVPCVLVSCKCDRPLQGREVDSRFDAKVTTSFPSVEICETSATKPESQKRCILSIMRKVLASSRESRHPSPQATRVRAATTGDKISSRTNNAGAQQLSAHHRSKSDLPRSRSRESGTLPTRAFLSEDNLTEDSDEDGDVENPPLTQSKSLVIDTSGSSHRRAGTSGKRTPIMSSLILNELVSATDNGSATPKTPDSLYMNSVIRPGTAHTADSQIHNTFLNMSEESQDESQDSDRAIRANFGKLKVAKDSTPDLGVSFGDLVDRLLLLPKSQRDAKFVPIFLCLYRSFATPVQLLTSVITRFEGVEKSKDVQLTKAGEQLRYLQILGQWTAEYPGDFAMQAVRGLAAAFVTRISKSRTFAGAAKEINNNLEANAPDDDAEWAFSGASATVKSAHTSSTGWITKTSPEKFSRPSKQPILMDDSDEGSDGSDQNADLDSSPRHSGAPSTSSSLMRTANTSSQSLANLLNLEQARQKAQRLRPIPRVPLSKIQWHQFMDTPTATFALEVTRTDWAMYTAIRPRDLIRHVSISTERRRMSTQVDNIGMMVKQFNHLALFVSGMILLRDKPKHRAKALEKFMAIAWKVRQMNNYNSLGAIVAGITGPEIQRLGMTRDLVPPAVQKDFLRLTILMSHSRSHTAYRMAWENSFAERIPFLPLVRQDLTRAQTGNQTFVGPDKDKIHWRKFEIMGDVIFGIQRSQELPYSFSQMNEEVSKLILETKVLEGSEESADPRDELQKRSELLEPAGVMLDGNRKKFDWFRSRDEWKMIAG